MSWKLEFIIRKLRTSSVLLMMASGRRWLSRTPCAWKRSENIFLTKRNVKVIPFAVWEKEEDIEMFRANASTFIGSIAGSPAVVNDGYAYDEKDRFVAHGKPFDRIDDGTIDLLSVDIEGAEWLVVKNMTSRPK